MVLVSGNLEVVLVLGFSFCLREGVAVFLPAVTGGTRPESCLSKFWPSGPQIEDFPEI